MQRKFERSTTGVLASLTIALTASFTLAASADGLPRPPGDGLRPAQCDEALRASASGEEAAGCARISGYVAAGSEFSAGEKIGGRPAPFEAPFAILMGVPLGALRTVGSFFLQVGHEDGAR
ncbi:MAG: hypothetical protein JO223_04100 [Hyphomicrobiales bacterium]|nr:hypothetical protein [Hyphomicrobiales bacterium]MBV8443201.1 hypothetical protein [Hyphomicrobiales bacterium]